jgi:hydroxymethylpyrimidine pyrophosphatase-like HAD family hydrolase
VATLARIAGVDLKQVAVLGDQFNDVPMFERAGIAIAMGQAPQAVKAKAAYISTSNDEDGVAHAIDAILLPMVMERA